MVFIIFDVGKEFAVKGKNNVYYVTTKECSMQYPVATQIKGEHAVFIINSQYNKPSSHFGWRENEHHKD